MQPCVKRAYVYMYDHDVCCNKSSILDNKKHLINVDKPMGCQPFAWVLL